MQLELAPHQSLVLYDGECAFCDASVMFVIDRDPDARFVFASLQSNLGQQVLHRHAPAVARGDLESIVVFDGHTTHTQSSAALFIARRLCSPVRWLSVLRFVPKALRDFCYRAFAKRRLRWFGQLEQCRIPTPELRDRFLTS